jgi:hypothetical protein
VFRRGFGNLAPSLLIRRNIKRLEGATYEDANRYYVQESAGADQPAEGEHLQTLWRSDLLIEFFETPILKAHNRRTH